MLQLAENEPGRYAQRDGKPADRIVVWAEAQQLALAILRDDHGSCEFVRLLLTWIVPLHALNIDERRRPVQKQVADLVEEREPEMVIRPMPEAHQDHRLVWRDHSASAAGAAPLWSLHYDERNADVGQHFHQRRHEPVRLADLRQSTNFVETSLKPISRPIGRLTKVGVELSFAQPHRGRTIMLRERQRTAESRLTLMGPIARIPGLQGADTKIGQTALKLDRARLRSDASLAAWSGNSAQPSIRILVRQLIDG